MKIYGIYEQRFILDGEFTQDESLNGFYDLSFFLNYPEYQLPTLIVIDGILTNSNKRIFIAEYDANLITQDVIDFYIGNIPKEFKIEILSNPAEWIRKNTNLKEIKQGKFLISEEKKDIMGETIPAKYLIIL